MIFFTSRILRTDEDIGCLGQPLHELSNALCVILSLAERAHHRAQDTANDARKQFWVESFSWSRGIRCWIWCCTGSWSSTRGRLGWRENGLGLQMKCKCWIIIGQHHTQITQVTHSLPFFSVVGYPQTWSLATCIQFKCPLLLCLLCLQHLTSPHLFRLTPL